MEEVELQYRTIKALASVESFGASIDHQSVLPGGDAARPLYSSFSQSPDAGSTRNPVTLGKGDLCSWAVPEDLTDGNCL